MGNNYYINIGQFIRTVIRAKTKRAVRQTSERTGG